MAAPSSDDITFPTLHHKTWSANASSILRGLSLDIPGRVFVSRNASLDAAAYVHVSSDSAALLDVITSGVTTGHDGSDYLEVRVPSDYGLEIDITGSLLLRIIVRDPLSWVHTSVEAILEDGSLVNTPNEALSIKATDSGNVYVDVNTRVDLASLDLITQDDGNVQFTAPSVHIANTLRLVTNDAGSVAIRATTGTLTGQTIESATHDDGSIYVTAAATIDANQLRSTVSDSGTINLYPRGTCGTSTVHNSDDGSVNEGSIVCQNVDVSLSGEGNAYVQATQSLKSHVSDDGRVYYFNSTPSVLPTPRPRGRHHHTAPATAFPTQENPFDEFTFGSPPPSELVPVRIVVIRRAFFFIRDFETGPQVYSHPFTLQMDASVDVASGGWVAEGAAIFGLVCIVLVLLGVVYKKRSARASYKPLLSR
ncbi:Aste57867_25320 [Aphanomyces stellatus]|uniref:Aste57867_25320 protein n=1 Tax=Aphanomyces stellatus TaxID=120398 RepID=A0A485LSV0_9STRA|nr:hypothetical protein As57867_025242 [Aphanomyces stellatus]VFU01945.1 Aste57867_25320 [Aphanomyces stellatus]